MRPPSGRYANFGCGDHYRPGWINIDLGVSADGVIRHDVTRGVPMPDESCDLVYHSHLLEHLRRPDALPFMRECRRVLRPGGVLRVATPDLELIARLYLQKLEECLSGIGHSEADYDWMVLELLDQCVREAAGGNIATYLERDGIPNEAFVCERVGAEARKLIDRASAARRSESAGHGATRGDTAADVPQRVARLRGVLSRSRRAVLTRVLGPAGLRALAVSRFRLGGEVHHWLYDRYSLARLMREAGFDGPVCQTANSSLVADWPRVNLDIAADGTVRKPDSLFMEARRRA